MTDIELSANDARQLTDRIKVAVEGTWQLIQEAYLTRAWSALGYATWDEYCTREFGTARLRLPREERQEVVASLRESGLSTRAIATATGLARNTVMKELAQNEPVDQPERVTSLDGRSRPASQPVRSRPAPTPTPTPRPTPEPREPDPSIWYGGPPVAEPEHPSGRDHADETAVLAEADARRDAELDAELEGTTQRFRANFARARRQAGEISTFDVDRIAEVFANNWDREVGDLLRTLRDFCDAAEAARKNRTGLRIVVGGSQ